MERLEYCFGDKIMRKVYLEKCFEFDSQMIRCSPKKKNQVGSTVIYL